MTTRTVTLTFDNGPQSGRTQWIVDQLGQRDLPAVFFMVGAQVAAPGGREAAEAVHTAGHPIGNHTMHHGEPLGTQTDSAAVIAEIADAQAVLGDLAAPEKFFRPNGGGTLGPHVLNEVAVDYLIANKFTVVTWNAVPRDWIPPSDGWVTRAKTMIAEQDWTVLVLHDIYDGIVHLPGFLDQLQAEGIEFTDQFPDSVVPIKAGHVQWPLEGAVLNSQH